MNPNLYAAAALVLAGILFHFVLKLGELEQSGKIITPWGYWRAHPYTSLTVVMSAYLFMALQHSMGELTLTSSILTGVACNSIGDKLRARADLNVNRGTGSNSGAP